MVANDGKLSALVDPRKGFAQIVAIIEEGLGIKIRAVVVRYRPEANRACHAFDSSCLVKLYVRQIVGGCDLNVFEYGAGPEDGNRSEAKKDGPEPGYHFFHRSIVAARVEPDKRAAFPYGAASVSWMY